jgi:hypothetical protein
MVTQSNPQALRSTLAALLAITCCFSSPTTARAQGPAAAAAPAATPEAVDSPPPRLLHTPLSVTPAAQPVELVAEFVHPESLRQAILIHRKSGETQFHEIPFRRGTRYYHAVIDGAAVHPDGLAYAIELELMNGERVDGFATRTEPFDVQVQLSKEDASEKAAAIRLGERRSLVTMGGEYVSFGRDRRFDNDLPAIDAQTGLPIAGPPASNSSDDFYRLEASYAYRPLRFVDEFGARLGWVRGTSPETADPNDAEVGLNYAAPWLRLRLHDVAYLTGHLLTGVTEVDFSLGVGAALTLGDPRGANLHLGFESIQGFGSRFFTRVNILASDRVSVAPIIEATNFPNAGTYGVRLLAEVGVQLTPAFRLAALGGYQARNAVSGAASFGGTASIGF